MTIGALMASLAVGLVVILVLVQGYQQKQQQATIMVENFSWVMEQTLAGSVRLIDHALMSSADEAERQLQAGGLDLAMFNAFLKRLHDRLPGLDGLRATDARGTTLYGEGVTPGANAVGRDYFERLFSDPQAGLAISKPLVGRISNKWAIIFARRYNLPDSGFGGVVFSPINFESFAKILAMVKVGEHGVISLLDASGSVIARYPEQLGERNPVGQNIPPRFAQNMVKMAENPLRMSVSPIDGIERLVSIRKVGEYPFYVAVGLSPGDYMADWWSNAAILVGLWVLFSVVVLVLTVQKARDWQQRLTTIRTLAVNAELESKVTERTKALEESYRVLEELSAKDGLTGIANRRRFEQALADEWNRAARTGQSLALALFDVDLFKNYNDHYGHLQGDDCLRRVACLIDSHARRSGDVVARYGGEEFAFLAPSMDAAAALTLMEGIRRALEAEAIPHAVSPTGCVTISVGVVALVPLIGGAQDMLVKMADDALYRAKRQGRNQAVLAETAVTD